MPPRGNRRKIDPVKQQENFEIWKKSDKHQH